MRLGHYYHVYAGGDWREIVADHVDAIVKSGLMDELDFFRVGIVGPESERAEVKRALPFAEVVAEASDGWEQHTLDALHRYALAETIPSGVLYAHTKGASSGGLLAHAWRVSMTHDVITGWKQAVTRLAVKDAVGAFWMDSDRPEHVGHKYFFGGNFWWATVNYLKRLSPIGWEHRFKAEGWIGLANPDVANLREGVPIFGHFYTP